MEGIPCESLSSDVLELRCKGRATKDSASNLHWPTEVAIMQSGSAAGLYKGVPERKEVRRAVATGSAGPLLSLSQRAQQRDQSEYLSWMEERCCKREGPLPVTPETHVVEDSREKRELARELAV